MELKSSAVPELNKVLRESPAPEFHIEDHPPQVETAVDERVRAARLRQKARNSTISKTCSHNDLHHKRLRGREVGELPI
jgi:hypothetical protein